MGEEHIRKRHQQMTRCTDAALDELQGGDLFSSTTLETGYEALGYSTGEASLQVGDELFEESGATSEKVVLCLVNKRAVELVGESARLAAKVREEFGEPLSAVVSNLDDGFVEVRFIKPFKPN